MSSRFGDILVKEEVISLDQLKAAIEEQKQTGKRLGETLLKLGYINEYELVAFLSKQYRVPAINLDEFEIAPDVLKLVPRESAVKHGLVPINRSGSNLVVAMSDPSNIFAIDDLKFATGHNIEVVVASERAIKNAIDKYYGPKKEGNAKIDVEDTGVSIDQIMGELQDFIVELGGEEEIEINDLARASEEAPVVKLVNHILIDAIGRNASDIHIEPYEKDYRVRYRIDGILYDIMRPPMRLKNAVSSRVKIMANLDIAERRLPQDGRIKLRLGRGRNMEYRVSVIPTIFGEKVVMRLLDRSSLQLDLTKLGFEEDQLKAFKDSIYKPYGMVLITGPTGSGKTTTLYSALMELNRPDVNISTAEDPVEYSLPGVNQVNIHEEIGLNFAACLRSFLRQDPDIILVGEIRDYETAEIAIKAALTGHLVLSTLHTNDAASSITRLLNMGIEPFLVTASLNAVAAQRLMRKVCTVCKEEVKVSPQILIDLGVPPKEVFEYKIYKGKGDNCKTCLGTGYKGRVAVYEVMVLTEKLKEFILSGASVLELKREAIKQGMKTLRQSALLKLKHGISTVEEVVRNTAPDN
ncbi:MAG: type IV-A pilus assembly ATPase PilB [Candidatus Dadabacteria bacterium]